MLFNSATFLIFLPIVLILYWAWAYKSIVRRNSFLLLSSYLFYGWWDYRFLLLIVASTLVDFVVAFGINKAPEKSTRKKFLWLSLIFNIGVLITFKYFNFFADSFYHLMGQMGWEVDAFTLNVILPVGISFYTFQTLSYTIDVYQDKTKATSSLLSFALYVAFFPQLVAGPIEKSTNLLPQFLKSTEKVGVLWKSSFFLIVLGFFKKVVVADNLAPIVDQVFEHAGELGAWDHIVGMFFFTFQIYCDFSGYSDIAIGVAGLFGFHLRSNFRFPYFAANLQDFWHRWHISLSGWFREYIYLPLGGSKTGENKTFRNVMIVFLVSGLWHGANVTFIIWGGLHGLLYWIQAKLKNNKINAQSYLRKFMSGAFTFVLVMLLWVWFRADNMKDVIAYFSGLGDWGATLTVNIKPILFILLLIVLDILNRKDERKVLQFSKFESINFATVSFIILLILNHFGTQQQFIYFQF